MHELNEPEVTESDLPRNGWAIIRIARPGDIYVAHKFGYWREVITGKEVPTREILERANATGWENRAGKEHTYRNHIGFEVIEAN